jgi:Mrp family chromosome partitioning ATPase
LLVVGVNEEDGASTVAINLARTLSENDSRVMLVDANTARDEVTKELELNGRRGYAELIEQCALRTNGDLASIKLSEYVVAQKPTLTVIPRGDAAGEHDLADVQAGRRLLRLLSSDSDLTVVETAPADRASSTLIWASVADATVLVVSPRKTTQAKVELALRTLMLAEANVIGTVFTS